MYQILTGKDFRKAVKAIPLKSAILYYSSKERDYCVWEISDEDFKRLNKYIDRYDYFERGDKPKFWNDSWGWWRWNSGSNIDCDPVNVFNINGNKIKCHYNQALLEEHIWIETEDFKEVNDTGVISEEAKENIRKTATKEYFSKGYTHFLKYCIEQYGASTEKNVCAIAVETAKLNKMSLAELFALTLK